MFLPNISTFSVLVNFSLPFLLKRKKKQRPAVLCFERLGPFSFRSLGSLNGMDSDHGDDGDGIDTKSRAAHHGQRRSGGRRLRRLIW